MLPLRSLAVIFFLICVTTTISIPVQTHADEASDIQSQIDVNSKQIEQLEADIKAFQKQLDALAKQKNTLQSTIAELTITQKQLASQIHVTEEKIRSANLEIQKLTLSIGDKEASIAANQAAIAKSLKIVDDDDRAPLVAQLITSRSFSDAWQMADEIAQFNRALRDDISQLRSARVELSTNRDKVTAVKEELVGLQQQLTQQKRSVDANRLAQQQLLNQTRNQESSYQSLIAQKQAAQKSFEKQLIDLQNQLQLIVNPKLLPKVGSGVLSWPFSLSFMNKCGERKSVFGNIYCVTQYFGHTSFSTANPQIYNGSGHNAIDIAAPIGTPVQAALTGTVLATGNTDLVRGCYSFGKWVMLKHANGLSTLYSHLSAIDVTKGQAVATGQVLGLSGMTGYATGPHLHFGVYASEGTQIMTLAQFRGATAGCANATMPVATLTAYLNPLSYL
jgi:murein DD-endopeptidase MepM/ murein hydrolase activator NlpD